MQVLFKGMCILVANTVQTIGSIFQHLLNKHFVSYFHITKHNYDGTPWITHLDQRHMTLTKLHSLN